MKRLIEAILIFLVFPLSSCSSYSDRFVEVYSETWNDALVVFPMEGGYTFQDNEILKQIIYPKYFSEYGSYSEFLQALLAGNISMHAICLGYKGYAISRYDLCPKFIQNYFIKKYFTVEEVNDGERITLKERLEPKQEIGLMKMMFDRGYFLFWDCYAAEVVISNQKHELPPY